MNTTHSLAQLEARFTNIWQRCLLPASKAQPHAAFQELVRCYGEETRIYHTLKHIAFCLEKFDLAKHLIDQVDAVEMAIWYHDIINDPHAKDNEDQSCLAFQRVAQGNFEQTFIDTVSELIMITTHRQTPRNKDEEYICDIDLSSMGDSWEEFIADSNDLLVESESSEEEYTLGKRKFFNALMERPSIYYSEFFNSRFENAARANIKRYLASLEQ